MAVVQGNSAICAADELRRVVGCSTDFTPGLVRATGEAVWKQPEMDDRTAYFERADLQGNGRHRTVRRTL
jgi:hypothetical protein